MKLPRRGNTGAIVARMDNTSAFRGWDLWIEQDKVGMHIINKWPDDAIQGHRPTAVAAEPVVSRGNRV